MSPTPIQALTYFASAIGIYSSISIFLTINHFRKPDNPSDNPSFLPLFAFSVLTILGNATYVYGIVQRALSASSSPPDSYQLALILVLQIASHSLWSWAQRTVSPKQFTRAMSKDTPKFLVTTGPYAYVRNPFYTAYLMTYAATAILAGRTVDFVLLGGFYVCYYLVSLSEQRKFERSGVRGEYAAFRKTRARFFCGGVLGGG
ncbi:hypothetical protein QBC34DRAFT_444093 [Podospora aff. communis PSN243]|uniref:Protein-S-isoprenylcysteine O-methyltransferase n=1 Tax=Podospora aff. communis PSN243 TaxID=3040156 RepID=A0AAV9G447_9PEZI|nr:hypothetical protein QBC34DRAFT_444093 [Podospora aff. communis PSN243]